MLPNNILKIICFEVFSQLNSIAVCKLTNYNTGGIELDIFRKKQEKFINEFYESKQLIPYVDVKQISISDIGEFENRIYDSSATVEDRMAVERFYFDMTFRVLNDEQREDIWNNNSRQFFKAINSLNISRILEDNGVSRLIDLDVSKLTLKTETIEYLKERFSTSKRRPNWLAKEVINAELGFDAITLTKGRRYKISNRVIELFNLNEEKRELERKERETRTHFIDTETIESIPEVIKSNPITEGRCCVISCNGCKRNTFYTCYCNGDAQKLDHMHDIYICDDCGYNTNKCRHCK